MRTVSESQLTPSAAMLPIPQMTLTTRATMLAANFHPALLVKTRCIRQMTEHLARQSVNTARISAARKDCPETFHSRSVVMELNLDSPWLRPWNMAPACPRHAICVKRQLESLVLWAVTSTHCRNRKEIVIRAVDSPLYVPSHYRRQEHIDGSQYRDNPEVAGVVVWVDRRQRWRSPHRK